MSPANFVVFPQTPYAIEAMRRNTLCDTQAATIKAMMRFRPAGVYLEIGSLLGTGSTRVVLENFPQATVVCLDLFREQLWLQSFINNVWKYRDRVRAIAGDSSQTLPVVVAAGITPDVIWIDGDHSVSGVYSDVAYCLRHFPLAIIGGDDWSTAKYGACVQKAIGQIVADGLIQKNCVKNNGRCWYFTNNSEKA